MFKRRLIFRLSVLWILLVTTLPSAATEPWQDLAINGVRLEESKEILPSILPSFSVHDRRDGREELYGPESLRVLLSPDSRVVLVTGLKLTHRNRERQGQVFTLKRGDSSDAVESVLGKPDSMLVTEPDSCLCYSAYVYRWSGAVLTVTMSHPESGIQPTITEFRLELSGADTMARPKANLPTGKS